MAFRKKSKEPLGRSVQSVKQSVPTYSYHHKINEDRVDNANREPNKKPLKPRTIWLEKFGFIVLAIVVCVCLISILYLSDQSQVIINPPTSGPSFASYKQDVQESAQKLISSSILNSNKITFDSQKVTTTLEDEYPMFSNISITLPLINHHPVIYLTPAVPALIISSNNQQYLVNQNGQIIEVLLAASSLNNQELPVIDFSEGNLNNDQKVLTSNEVQFIQTIVYELAQKNLQVSHMNLPQNTSEIDAYIKGLGYYVKFNLQNNDAKQQAGSFLAAKHYLSQQGTAPAQYVDVRTDGRVYYQ